MTAPGVGVESWIGFGEESTYRTPVSASKYLDISSESLKLNEAKLESGALAEVGILSNRFVQGFRSVEGDITFESLYDGWEMLAKHAFGSVTTTQPDVTNAPTAYQHVFEIADTLPTGLTFEVFRDTSQFTTEPNKSFQYAGCKINSLTMENSVDDILRVTASIMGGSETRISKTSETLSSQDMAVYHQGILTWNDVDKQVNNWSITMNNNLGWRPYMGSRFSREPLRDAKIEVVGTFECEFDSWAEYDDFKAATTRKLQMLYEGSSLGGSIVKTIKLECEVAVITDVEVTLDSPGRIMMTFAFKAYRSATYKELQLTMINTVATV